MLNLHEKGLPKLKPSAQSYTIIINACAFSANMITDKHEKSKILQIATDALHDLEKQQ